MRLSSVNRGTGMDQEIARKTRRIIHEQLHADESLITPGASFIEDLGADSLHFVELTLTLEEEFGIDISDEDAERIRTVQDAVDYIEKHVKVSS